MFYISLIHVIYASSRGDLFKSYLSFEYCLSLVDIEKEEV